MEFELPEIEGLWLEIRAHNVKFLLGTYYRPPNANSMFWTHLQEVVDVVKTDKIKNVILTDDFNADPQTPEGVTLNKFANINHLRIHSHDPTRYETGSSRILDQFLSNNFVREVNILPPVLNFDHCTISIHLKLKMKKVAAYKRLMWDYKNANFDQFRDALSKADFDFCDDITDINVACENWTKLFISVAKLYIPNKIVVVQPSDKPLFVNHHRRLRKRNMHTIWLSCIIHRFYGQNLDKYVTYIIVKLRRRKLNMKIAIIQSLSIEGKKTLRSGGEF